MLIDFNQTSRLLPTYVQRFGSQCLLPRGRRLTGGLKLGLSAFLGLAIVIGRNGGDIQHKAYVRFNASLFYVPMARLTGDASSFQPSKQ